MRSVHTILLLCAVSLSFGAAGLLADDDVFPSYFAGKNDPAMVTVTSDAIDKTPTWAAVDVNPPLSARKAISLAEGAKSKLIKEAGAGAAVKWRVGSASLVACKNNRWYWLITYETKPESRASTGPSPQINIPVLMDGTVVQPMFPAKSQ